MPTDNPKISSYVPQVVYDRFKQFQEERNLSMSQAIIIILAEYFEIEEIVRETTKGATVGGVTLGRVEALENSYKELFEKLKELEKISKLHSELVSKLPNEVEEKIQVESENNFNNVASVGSLPLVLLSELPLEIKPILGNKLSKLRFGLAKDTVSGHKSKDSTEEFIKWSKEHDPDGIGWKYVESPVKGYLPDSELSSEQKSRLLEWIEENIN